MALRQNMIYSVVGEIGSGKTDNMKNIIWELREIFNKVVIFDEFDSDVWDTMETWDHPERMNMSIPIIPEEKLLYLKKGIVRIVQKNEDIEHYYHLFRELRNTVIVLEDSSRFIESEEKLSTPLSKLILDVKQKNIELFFVFHSLMDVPPKLARRTRILIMHKTGETEIPRKWKKPKVISAFKRVMESKDEFFKVSVPLNVKIK